MNFVGYRYQLERKAKMEEYSLTHEDEDESDY